MILFHGKARNRNKLGKMTMVFFSKRDQKAHSIRMENLEYYLNLDSVCILKYD
ncbi:hypothetical protein M948_03335 [Virgibacillus sp. CM-4]|nr:hypothetical protein M948_03335 [Virgibacillus sp. CM-4]